MSLRERKKVETKMKIIENAVELFKEKGYEQTSMEDIAESCFLSKGTLYNYFAEKRQIVSGYFDLCVRQNAVRCIADSHQSIIEDFKHIAEFFRKIVDENKELAKIYFNLRFIDTFEEKQTPNGHVFNEHSMGHVIYNRLKKGQNEGEIKKDISAVLMTKIFQTIMINILLTAISDDDTDTDTDEIITQAYDLFFYGILDRE